MLSGDVMADILKITTVEYGLESESLQMTDGDCPQMDVGEIPLLKDIRCIMKDTRNMAESSNDKRRNRSLLGIAMHIRFGSDHTSKEYRSLCHPIEGESIPNMLHSSSCMFEHALINCHNTALQVKYRSLIETHL
jgi:hypothetical protein